MIQIVYIIYNMMRVSNTKLWILVLGLIMASMQQDIGAYRYTMTYGSCYRHQFQFKDSLIFDRILDESPDSFVWLGDFAYLDNIDIGLDGVKFSENTDEVIKKKFEVSYNDPYYVRLRESTKIYGIWDDHDSGINNSDKSNNRREFVRQLFLDYMEEPKDSIRRTRKGGMYQSYYLDEQKNIKLILLDGRYDRDSLTDTSIPYDKKSILGKEQEQWLIKEVKESKALFTVLGFGNQIIYDDRPIIEHIFKSSKMFLLKLFNSKTNIVFISGDVHMAEIGKEECAAHINGYDLWEFTSSGLSHSVSNHAGNITDVGTDFIYPDTYNTLYDRYTQENYGVIHFDIDPSQIEKSSIEVHLKDYWGNTRLYKKLVVERDFPKRVRPDELAFDKCIEARGSPSVRMYKNMIKKGTNPLHPAFYILFGMVTLLIIFLYIVYSMIKAFLKLISRLVCPKSRSEKKKKVE